MNGQTHITIGIATGLAYALAAQSSPEATALIVAAAAVGSTLPDIDHPGSTVSRRAWPLRLGLFWLPHRGITHSLLIMGALMFLGLMYPPYPLALAFGYQSHIIADMMTKNGVQLLWPLRRRVGLPRAMSIKTGRFIEQLVRLGAAAACCGLLWMMLSS